MAVAGGGTGGPAGGGAGVTAGVAGPRPRPWPGDPAGVAGGGTGGPAGAVAARLRSRTQAGVTGGSALSDVSKTIGSTSASAMGATWLYVSTAIATSASEAVKVWTYEPAAQ